ncbi:hypothetical protein EDB81DRAFT_913581 [Dactylonectria macrodidyma]|uniref:Uncharacterized protein n=1 Tax=Dactylonectria macrodidyma TaxID=307937 RepID=A0A9P9DLH7_9HYPO|nr:hypothetical protein EDB81DRAFT_913581 [Dactylonectria macrodidyma]
MATAATQKNGQPAEQKGRKTIIADYCQRRSEKERGYKECVFLCLRRGRRYYAIDIPIKLDDPTLGLDRLRKESGPWWKRYSLYSAVGVQEINMRLMELHQPSTGLPEIRVSILNLDYAEEISLLDSAIEEMTSRDIDPFECGMDVNGQLDKACRESKCRNTAYNEQEDLFCRVYKFQKFSRRRSDYIWLPSMLKYYWQNGVDGRGLAFLSNAGFVHSYKDLQYDTYRDAATPYGRTIPAFLLIEGWHIRYLLVLVGASLVGSACVIAITAALAQSIEIALTAGSYTCGISMALIAVLAFLSGVL